MATTGVVDGDVEPEVVRIYPQLRQFTRADQQMQGQLLVAQVVADHLGQVVACQPAQGQLLGALDVMVVAQAVEVVAAVAGQQAPVDEHMVQCRYALPEFLQVGTHQALETLIVPVRQQAVEPGPIHQLGGRHATQEVQGMGEITEVASRLALATAGQVVGIGSGGAPGVCLHPRAQARRIGRQLAGQLRRLAQLPLEKPPRQVQGQCRIGLLKQLAIEGLHLAGRPGGGIPRAGESLRKGNVHASLLEVLSLGALAADKNSAEETSGT
ncbi:hypothetical protein D9M71_428700 [compost metagenome]